MKNANAADIPVGVYLYSKAKTVDEARAEAQYVINTMQGYQVSYPVVFDLEDTSQSNLGKKQLGAIAKAFCQTSEEQAIHRCYIAMNTGIPH